MRFYINIISLLIILSSSSINYKIILTTAAESGKIVTKEYITNICSKSSNPPLCFDLLKTLIGHPIARTTFAAQALRPIDKAKALARDTYKMIEGMYKSLIDPRREVRERYQRCMAEYYTVIKYLGDAKGFMQRIDGPKKVKSYAASAANRVNSCDRNFAKPPQIPLNLKNANQKFKDVCNVIVAICNNV